MTAFNGQSLTYDPDGNLLSDGTNTYSWDSRNNLLSLAGPAPAGFTYDSSGRRESLTINGGTTRYIYENGGPLAQEVSPLGIPLMSGLGTSRLDSAGAMTFLYDESGSVIALTDSAGTIQTQYSYGPFGAVAITGAASNNPYQFAGMQNDGTGVYFGPRGYYESTLGLTLAGGTRGLGAASSHPIPPGVGSCGKCKAELRTHQAWYFPSIIATHSFWYIIKASGQDYTISGEDIPDIHGFLNVIWGPGTSDTTGAGLNHDNVADSWLSWPNPCNSDVCSGVSYMLDRAKAWPYNLIDYHLAHGPNSNSAARYLGKEGGLVPPAYPTGGHPVAWEKAIPLLEH